MLRSLDKIIGYRLQAIDGEIGRVRDFYFDGHSWAVCYIVVDTGRWLSGRQVLISPQAAGTPDADLKVLPVELTREQIRESPPVETNLPVSRRQEVALARYYGWTPYWQITAASVGAPVQVPVQPLMPQEEVPPPAEETLLRSAREVIGYAIAAADGTVGQVDDLIVQTDTWVIRYLQVDTRRLLPGRKVLVSPAWVQQIAWTERRIAVDESAEEIKNSPKFDPDKLTREYEEQLHRHYGRHEYWSEETEH